MNRDMDGNYAFFQKEEHSKGNNFVLIEIELSGHMLHDKFGG